MIRFTMGGDPALERVVERELRLIVEAVVQLAGRDLTAILLVGGFGRGEGGAVRDGMQLRPMNDYDVVVLGSGADGDVAGRIENGVEDARLQSRLSVKQVDVMVTTATRLAIPVPTVARYEMKNGHRILWGALRHPIRAVPARWLPMHEGTKFYRNRTAGLLIARLLLDGCGQLQPEIRRELAFLEINKALLAPGDAHLIQSRTYHYSYVKRRELIEAEARRHRLEADVATACIRALDDRRELDAAALAQRDLDAEWHRATGALVGSMVAFEAQRYARTFRTFEEYATYVADQLLSGRFWRAVRSRAWVREDMPTLVKQRLTAVELLLERARGSAVGAGDGVAPTLGTWGGRTTAFLREWHPAGIVRRLVGG